MKMFQVAIHYKLHDQVGFVESCRYVNRGGTLYRHTVPYQVQRPYKAHIIFLLYNARHGLQV